MNLCSLGLSLETPNAVPPVANTHRMFKGLAKVLIRLRVCAGWSERLLVAHTTLLEISCHGSYISIMSVRVGEKNPSRGLPLAITRLAE